MSFVILEETMLCFISFLIRNGYSGFHIEGGLALGSPLHPPSPRILKVNIVHY